MLEFTTEHQNYRGTITARADGQVVGHITFVPRGPGVIDLNHTEVDPQFGGKGYGAQLVRAASAFARAEGLGLEASCPFARKVLDREPR
jgi:uncharacterized protein